MTEGVGTKISRSKVIFQGRRESEAGLVLAFWLIAEPHIHKEPSKQPSFTENAEPKCECSFQETEYIFLHV